MIARILAWWRKQRIVEQPDIDARATWATYIGNDPDPCSEGHTRIYVTDAACTSMDVICSVCTAPLQRPAWTDCDRCHWLPIAGRLHVVHCPRHTPDQAAA